MASSADSLIAALPQAVTVAMRQNRQDRDPDLKVNLAAAPRGERGAIWQHLRGNACPAANHPLGRIR